MAKGMVDSPGCSRLPGLGIESDSRCDGLEVGGAVDVGEGSTSVKRAGGSFLDSLFQMAFPQVNGLGATRPPAVPVDVEGRFQACSGDTVLEAGEPGDKGPAALAKELRLGGMG
jgi:hypothetical protein